MAGSSSPTVKRRRWPKIVGGLLAILILLVAAVYFFVTSERFLKRTILPKVSDAANADVTVGSASVSPFSKVVLRDLKVHPRGAEPLLTAQEVRLKYSLLAILRGNYKVEEVFVAAPVVELVTHPDGTSNLDPILKAQKKDEKEKEPSRKPSEPPKVDLKNLTIAGATVRQIKQVKAGKPEVTELTGLNLTVSDVRNGQSGKLALSTAMKMDSTNGVLEAKAAGDYTFALSPDLKPTGIKGESRFEVGNVTGAFAEAKGLSSTLSADASPTEVRALALQFAKNGNALGEIRAQGPFDLARTEGRLNVAISSIDRQVLSLLGGRMGLDFGKTLINSSNQVELTKGGKVVAMNGLLNVAQFNLQNTNGATPPIDIVGNYNLSVDTEGKVAKIQTLAINGTQQGKRLLHVDVPQPMTITWGEVVVPTGDSALNLALMDLNLADWTPFAGGDIPLKTGTVNVAAKATSHESGKQVRLDVTSRVDNISMVVGTNLISDANVLAHFRGTLTDVIRVKISQLQAEMLHKGQPIASVTGGGQYDRQSLTSDLQLALQADLPRAIGLFPQPNLKVSSGAVAGNVRVQGSQQAQIVTGAMALTNFTGQLSETRFDKYGVTANLDVQKTERAVEIKRVAGTITEGTQPGGSFALTGNYATNGVAQLNVKLDGLNENALEPFLAASLKDKKLISVSLNGNADLRYDPAGASAVKSDVKVANLVVSDPQKKIPATPLEARMQLDTSLERQVLDLRQARLGLTPTQRATNELNVTGRLDMSKTNALEGTIKVLADALDLTAYYDIFAGQNAPATPPTAQTPPPGSPPSTAPAPARAQVQQEPAPMQLPVRHLGLEMNIGRLYLRELDIANLRASPQIEGSRIRTGPIELAVNGAPIKTIADVNLGVPGYQYVVSASLDKVPLEPFVNTFKPEQRGKMKGELIATANISGTGSTGPSLKKHLDGQVRFDLTNGNVQVASTKFVSNIVIAVAVASGLPELTESPVQEIHMETKMGAGQIDVSTAQFLSPLLAINTAGAIQIADVLTNSTIQNWPVTIAVRKTLADRVPRQLLQASDLTNEYVRLVNFLRIHGTIGDPKHSYDKKAIASQVIDQVGKRVGDETVQKAFKAVGDLLGGRQQMTNAPATTNVPPSAATNAPGTNQPPRVNVFDLIPKPRQ